MTNDEDFPKKCQVLAEFWIKHRVNPELAGLFNHHDIRLPLAFMQKYNFCVATDKGIEEINQVFDDLVEIVENEEEHSEQIAAILGEQFMTTTSRATNITCGNKYCDNKSVKVNKICGKLISSIDKKCNYLNYPVARPIYSFALEFIWSVDLAAGPENEASDPQLLRKLVDNCSKYGRF